MKTMSIKEYALRHKISIYNVVKQTKNGSLQTQMRKVDGKDEIVILVSEDPVVTTPLAETDQEKIDDYEKAYFKLKIKYDQLNIKYNELLKSGR